MIEKLKKYYQNKKPEIVNGMILSHIQPHTRPVEKLTQCSSGVITAKYYFGVRYFDCIDDDLAKNMVAELKKLQITDENSPHYGCMRWYREETFVTDSNGAFFVLLPLAIAYKFCKDKLTAEEKSDIEQLLSRGSKWFLPELSKTIFYTNKILSDGAISTLIAHITGNGRDECLTFWNKWLDYAETRGMGWGENTSDVYSAIILDALNLAILTIDDDKLKKRIENIRETIIDYLVFHSGKPMVPSIRTYNFDADDKQEMGGYIYKAMALGENENALMSAMSVIIAKESGMVIPKTKMQSNFRTEKIFDSSVAYTWKGNGIRLGTVSQFPVMKNCYQRDGWGLGWQSMPACILVENNGIVFLRERVEVNGNTHTHPAINKHNAFLSNRLFEDGNLKTVMTNSSQNKNIAIVSRGINKLANSASAIYDEWCIPKNDNTVIEAIEYKGRKWYLISCDNRAIALTHLGGFAHGYEGRGNIEICISESGIFDTVSAKLYYGEQKILFDERLESSWIIIAFEDKNKIPEDIEQLEITDETLLNIYEAEGVHNKSKKITCNFKGETLELTVSPDSYKS